MKNYTYPFMLTLLATFTPVVAQLLHLNYKELTYITPFAAIFLLANLTATFRFTQKELLLIAMCGMYLFCSISLGIGIGSGGTLLVVAMALLFKRFFVRLFCLNMFEIKIIIKWVLMYYKINIVYHYIELVLVIAGFQPTLIKILASSNALPGYKSYNHAHFLHFIGFTDVRGLGGLFMGSQAAGMISVMSLIIFLVLRNYDKKWKLWFILSAGSTVFCSNMTSLLMLMASVFMLIFVFNGRYNCRRYKILFTMLFPVLLPIVFFKIDNRYEIESYWISFLPAVQTFVSNITNWNYEALLFGYGSVGHALLAEVGENIGTDLGMLTLINRVGLFLFFVCLGGLAVLNSHAVNAGKRMVSHFAFSENFSFDNHYVFYVANVIIVNMLFISLVHYSSAIEVGLRELFALHLSLAMLMGSCFFNKKTFPRHGCVKVDKQMQNIHAISVALGVNNVDDQASAQKT